MPLYVILAIIVLLVMIVIHEFGHYIAGKLLKFKINEFAIGFGPKIFSKVNQKTGERFSLRLIPLGGFCAFEGEDEIEKPEDAPFEETPTDKPKFSEEAEAYRSELKNFNDQEPWKRIIVLISGALFNFVSAIIFSFIFLLVCGVQCPQVVEVYSDSSGVSYNSELHAGDVILSVNGEKITPLKDYNEVVSNYEGNDFTFTVSREGEILNVKVSKKQIVTSEQNYFGFGMVTKSLYNTIGFGDSLLYCVPYTFELAWAVLGAFGQMVVGAIPLKDMSGPVSTIGFMAEATQVDWRNLLILLPLIASNLAVFNLLPIPALDGSKVVFSTIEWIRKKPINRNVEAYIHLAGFAFMIIFVIVIELLKVIG